MVRSETQLRGDNLENSPNPLLCLVGVLPAIIKEFFHCVTVLLPMISIPSSDKRTGREILVFQRKDS